MTKDPPAAQSQMRTVIAFEAKSFVFASYLNVGIAILGDRPSVEVVRHLRKITTDLVAAHGCTSTFYIGMSNAPLPQRPARAAVQEMNNEIADQLVAVATVFFGSGFWVSALRGFATSLHSVSGGKYDWRTFTRCDEAARWLAKLHSEKSLTIDAGELEREIAALLERPSVRQVVG